MRHLKIYEKWTSSVTDDVDVNYGDKQPELYSDIVNLTVNYIEENFNEIQKVDIYKQKYIQFYKDSKNELSYILLNDDDDTGDNYRIVFQSKLVNNFRQHKIDITKDEYDYLFDFFKKIKFRLTKKDQKSIHDDIISELDPIKRAAKKYNL